MDRDIHDTYFIGGHLATLEEAAKQSVKMPDSFFPPDDDRMFDTWGRTGWSRSRDSDLLTIANYETILKLLHEDHPEWSNRWYIMHSHHWAVGWVDEIVCEVYRPCGECEDGVVKGLEFGDDTCAGCDGTGRKITDIFTWFMEMHDSLSDYPVLDDEHHSKLEYADALAVVDQHRPAWEFTFKSKTYEVKGDLPDDVNEQIFGYIFDVYSYSRGEEIGDDEVNEAMVRLGFAVEAADEKE